MIIQDKQVPEKDRKKQFKKFAEQEGKFEVTLPPLYLKKNDRRVYLRETLLEDHKFRVKNNPEGAQAKFDKLSGAIFNFFRGTALVFYRDHAGMDLHFPIVFTVGDIHPENFGVMPNASGAPFFGVNDFDEAFFAPFSYDVKRGSTGFYIAARYQNGLKKKKAKEIVREFVKGYLDALISFARDDRERDFQYRIDNSPKIIKKLLENAKNSRKGFLKEKVDLKKERFKSTEEIIPFNQEIEKFRKSLSDYLKTNKIANKAENFYEIRDVAIKKGSGTASLGLDRYWVLINGETNAPEDDIILELKQARPSALDGLIPTKTRMNGKASNQAQQAAEAQRVQLTAGDPFYGYTKLDDKDYIIRERSPFKETIDTEDLDYKKFKEYARVCGKALAHTHARSDKDSGTMKGDAEKKILASLNSRLFIEDVVRFAKNASKRIKKDYKIFLKDHKMGAFRFTDKD